jgi:hypothetical protein
MPIAAISESVLPPRPESSKALDDEIRSKLTNAERQLTRLSSLASVFGGESWLTKLLVWRSVIAGCQLEGISVGATEVFMATAGFLPAPDGVARAMQQAQSLAHARTALREANSPGQTAALLGGFAEDDVLKALADDSAPVLVRLGLALPNLLTARKPLARPSVAPLLAELMLERWGLLPSTVLGLAKTMLSAREVLDFWLNSLRLNRDWAGWLGFFLELVEVGARDSAELVNGWIGGVDEDRRRVRALKGATVFSLRVFDGLLEQPVTSPKTLAERCSVRRTTAGAAAEVLRRAGVLTQLPWAHRGSLVGYSRLLDGR